MNKEGSIITYINVISEVDLVEKMDLTNNYFTNSCITRVPHQRGLIPILALDLPELFNEGLRIDPLKLVLPFTGVLFILGHLFFGITTVKRKILPALPIIALIVFSVPVALKPILPDIIADKGAIGYGISTIYFTWSYLQLMKKNS